MTGPRTAMILAAGFGTRMRPLTDACPKPLLRVAGRPMIDLVLDHAAAAGVRRAVVNLHYLGGMIRAHLAARAVPEICFSDEQPVILETGGGIVQALPLLGAEPFYAVNSDAVWAGPNPLACLAGAWDAARMDALLLLVPRARVRGYARAGDFFLEAEGAAPARRGTAAAAPLVYTGAQVIAPGAFAGAPQGPFSVNLVWDALLAKGRLAAVTYPGTWVDVGTPAGLAEAESALAEAGE
ncbi:MAG TPA: nucleotidyltransferase family protein [Thermohalobaculum sp.]|nr:nucleotidyltransferase family protein [Thermohalobaculum sp.]